MIKHNISEAELREEKPSQDPHEVAADTEYDRTIAYTQGRKTSKWEGTLSVAIQKLIGTVGCYLGGIMDRRSKTGTLVYNKNGTTQEASGVVYFGPESDVRDAVEMFHEWGEVIAAMARLRFGGCFRGEGRSYAEGFARSLWVKVNKMEADEKARISAGKPTALAGGESCTALVLVNALAVVEAKRKKSDSWLNEEHGIKLRAATRHKSGRHFDDAYGRGQADGNNANFSRDRQGRINR